MLLVQDLYKLRQLLEEKGCFTSVWGRATLKLLVLLLLFVAGYSVALYISSYFGLFLLVPLAIPLTVIMMIGHEAGHQAMFRSRSMNTGIFFFIFSMLGGLSATYWICKHNTQHHAAPNVLGRDHDIDVWPMAFYQRKINAVEKPLNFFQKHLQRFFFWGLCFFTAFSMRLDGIRYLFKHKGLRNKAMLLDIALLLMHYLLWLVIPVLLVGVLKALIFFLFQWIISGWILAMIFIVGHAGQPIIQYVEGSPISLALITSRNIKLPYIVSWFFVGLDGQIEHHLFPKLNHLHMRKARRYVQSWILAKHLPYYETTLFQALKEVYNTLKTPLKVKSFQEL